MIWLVGLVVA